MFKTAGVRDAEEMKRCNDRCLPENYPLELWQSTLKRNPGVSVVALETLTKIKGYVFTVAKDEETMHLFSIAVYPRFRNQGVGGELIDRTVSAIKTNYPKIKSLVLELRISNPALSLYLKKGFVIEKTLEGLYADGENGYEMKLNLGEVVPKSYQVTKDLEPVVICNEPVIPSKKNSNKANRSNHTVVCDW